MIKKIPGTLLLILIFSSSFAQTVLVSGTLADKDDKRGVAYSLLTLIDPLTKLTKSNTFTNEQGKFVFDKLPSGIYVVVVKSGGYIPYNSGIINVFEESIELDTLFLVKTSKDLKEVTVVAVKPLLEIETDKTIYNVENDITLQGQPAIEALKKLPFVTVDAEGNIQVKGSSNFLVLLNGKRTSIVAKNPSEALKSFPADLIKRIEVITEPSAKYDAEGTAGIINIITKKRVMGYNGNLYTDYSTRGMNNGGASLNVKYGKLGLSSYLGGHTYKYLNQTTSSLTRINKTPGYRSTLNQYSTSNSNGNWIWGNFELAYDIDSLQTLSIYVSPNGGSSSYDSHQQTEIRDSNNLLTESFRTDVESENKNPGYDLGFDFGKRFEDNEEHEISFAAYREVNKDNSSYTSIQNYFTGPDIDIFNTNKSKNIEHTFELEYEKPYENKSKLEMGTKMILRNLVSDYKMQQRNNSSENYTENSNQTNRLQYDQNIGSIYSVYIFPVKIFKVKLGGRAEQTWINAIYNKDSLPVTSDYVSLIPTASVSCKIKKAHTFRLNYSKRIQRPWMFYLNPYVNNQNPKSISFGNPNLLPEKTHSVSFSWNYFFKKNSLDISASNSFTDDVITSFTTLDTAGIAYTSYFNIAKSNTLGLNVSFHGMLFKKMQVWASASTSYVNITHKMDPTRNRSGFNHRGNGNITWNFKYGISTTLGGWIWQGAPTLQTVRPLNYSYTLAVRKSFFKKKLNAGIVANNFLQQKQSLKTISEDPFFYSESIWNNNLFRYYSVSVSFNFGKLSENVSRKIGVSNDDKKSSD